MIVIPIAVTQPIWKNIVDFGRHVCSNPLEGFADSIITPDSPAAFPACIDFCNQPLHNLSKGHIENNTFHHCTVSFGISLDGKMRGIRGVEILELENNCIIVTGSVETWYELIDRKLRNPKDNQESRLLCFVLLHLERIGFREMFAKFEKVKVGEGLYYIKEV